MCARYQRQSTLYSMMFDAACSTNYPWPCHHDNPVFPWCHKLKYVPLMPQTRRYIHPTRNHTRCASSSHELGPGDACLSLARCASSSHELGPGDACLSLACSSIPRSSAMAFFFVATYTKHRMFIFLGRSFYCIQDLIALQIANIQLLNITYKQCFINYYIKHITLSYVQGIS